MGDSKAVRTKLAAGRTRVLEVSTAHLTQKDAQLLQDSRVTDALPIRVMSDEYGFFVTVPFGNADFREAVRVARKHGLSDALRGLLMHAQAQWAAYLLIDRDGPVMDSAFTLPVRPGTEAEVGAAFAEFNARMRGDASVEDMEALIYELGLLLRGAALSEILGCRVRAAIDEARVRIALIQEADATERACKLAREVMESVHVTLKHGSRRVNEMISNARLFEFDEITDELRRRAQIAARQQHA